MPRSPKGPRLWLRKARRDKSGKLVAQPVWIILDAGKHHPTGCLEREAERAAQKLAEYITGKYQPARAKQPIEKIHLADVLSVYVDDSRQTGKKFLARIARLNAFWGRLTLADVNGAKCREYAQQRGDGGARRDLEDLRAAINHHREEGYHRELVEVVLPPKGEARMRWLTREEAAKLLWACWRRREIQLHSKGPVTTDKYPLRHLARFILIGLYTGTRAGAIATASPEREEGRSFVDLDRGIFYRLAIGKKATNKRQPPAPIPPRLLAHMRRWHRKGIIRRYFVEWNGKPVSSVKTAFKSAVAKAGIEHAYPHCLRHTAATWLMQRGAPIWQAAGFLGMSEKVLRDTYGHQHPDFMGDAVRAITAKAPVQTSTVVPLVPSNQRPTNGGREHFQNEQGLSTMKNGRSVPKRT